MKILITSGGTTVPIDPVRSITNTSTGRFGAALAKAALAQQAEVMYLVAHHAQSPFCFTWDSVANTDRTDALKAWQTHLDFTTRYQAHFQEYRFHDFADYADQLKQLTLLQKPDVIILAAAVSDYIVSNYTAAKIRSSDQLHIALTPTPKLIHHIKEWLPTTFLVGFKLLVNASDADLRAAAEKSMWDNQADLIVANDLVSLQRGQHSILLVDQNGQQKVSAQLAETVINAIFARMT